MKITTITNEFGETNMIICLSEADIDNLNDGSGCAYVFDHKLTTKMLVDVTVVKEVESGYSA